MNVFHLRHQLIDDYADYIRSFINIQDRRIDRHVDAELRDGLLWPDPLLQLNPSFEAGAWIDDLVDEGVLHPECKRIFRLDKQHGAGKPLRLHKHQSDAVTVARSRESYVLTTGTGSGKSLAYIIPIVDYILRQGSGKGIRAIIVYPMNALANSQFNELEKFLRWGYAGDPPVTFERYTGQEGKEKRAEILANPPDIILTNYVMLELLLTRPEERKLVSAARGSLQFLVLDELHTYRGRQGADVAMLGRRVREIMDAPNAQFVGTSATLATEGTFEKQQRAIAELASRLFGVEVKAEHVIGETLRRATVERANDDPDFVAELQERLRDPERKPPTDYDAFITDPLSAWIESNFGLSTEPGSQRLRRATPISISGPEGAARKLSQLTGVDEQRCRDAIEEGLLAGYDVVQPETGFPVFAFRLHQFISRGDTVYASLDPPENRHITTRGQKFTPGSRDRILLPLAFCRECGQEYYVVSRQKAGEDGCDVFIPRALNDQSGGDDDETGFLYANAAHSWPSNDAEIIERLPDDWLEMYGSARRVRKSRRKKLPAPVRVDGLGRIDADGELYHFIKAPFGFCLNCGVSYSSRERSDFGKLAALSSEGRSTATTILSLATLRALRDDGSLPFKARKLLSFTDNRQDAALQAGHFNDFVEVGQLRSALYQAVYRVGDAGVTHDQLAARVFDALSLPFDLYAVDPGVKFQAKRQTEAALREVLAYRVYQDLRRGWRITSPNLEQTGLLKIRYESLDELCAAEEEWANLHPALTGATPAEREEAAQVLLDHLRRELAIKVDYLDANYQESIKQKSSQRLIEPWAIDENEVMVRATIAFPRSKRPGETREHIFISARGGFGQYLRRTQVLPRYTEKLTLVETEEIIVQLFETLRVAGLVEVIVEDKGESPRHGYQIPASAFVWLAGDGRTPFHDWIRVPNRPREGARTNAFFVDFYRNPPTHLQGFIAKEHTAQVPNEKRLERERRFRAGELPLLYCSPTMELGVDISQLNAVNMRNVPPTPANYAQRSGRAGRSGQPALVFTYCTTGSPHDQYFFKRPQLMVSGAVAAPRLDLANEDLVRAHVHAMWLAETGLSLGRSLVDVLDVDGDPPSLALKPSVQAHVNNQAAKDRTLERMQRIFDGLADELTQADWYHPNWLQQTLDRVGGAFDQACDRWRSLYRAASAQREHQHKIVNDHSRPAGDRSQAKRLRSEAEAQLEILTQSGNVYQSDFYSYRYFASEGFLPGYNFPRLPLSAYIPGRRLRGSGDEYLNRPRFLAISEFGPRSIIYHEGSRYLVNRVILPVDQRTDEGLATQRAKICPHCGYLHPVVEGESDPDRCEHCNEFLEPALHALFRMQNVSTRRRERINSDEEERVRMGYELMTTVRLGAKGGVRGVYSATVESADGRPLLRLTYGRAATLWRINLGWRRRKEKNIHGFILDIERGYWGTNKQAVENDPEDPMSPSTQRVVPYVEDRRNCLLIEPAEPLTVEQMASLQPALKNAIQVLYQIEDAELAAEPLPSRDERNLILIYESAEGGAGVLRQLFEQPHAFSQVAREALALTHFDPETGEDLHRTPGAREDCVAACYDCLMSYYNQMDHQLVDRTLIRDLLLDLASSVLHASPGSEDRASHLAKLRKQCESDLEQDWLDFLEEQGLALPDAAQQTIDACQTRPDFVYSDEYVVIYIDGPVHDKADIAAKDQQIIRCLEDLGYTVIRFGYRQEEWPAICADHAYLFGVTHEQE